MGRFKCQKCGCRALETRIETTFESLEAYQVIRCVLCGWRISRPVPTRDAERKEKPAKATIKARRGGQLTYAPCPVPGCRNRIALEVTKSGLCTVCGGKIRVWEAGKRTVASPIQRINGFWYHRDGALIPGDPGSLPAPKIEQPRTPKPKAHRVRRKPQARTETPAIEIELERLARAGRLPASLARKLTTGGK